MKRFNVLIILIVIGLVGIYQFMPIGLLGDYCIGIINSLFFIGLTILYITFLIYEIYLNIQEVNYQKKKFDRSSIYITLITIIFLLLLPKLVFLKLRTIIALVIILVSLA